MDSEGKVTIIMSLEDIWQHLDKNEIWSLIQCNVDIVKSLVRRHLSTIWTFFYYSACILLNKLNFGYSKLFTISKFFTIHILLYPRYTVYGKKDPNPGFQVYEIYLWSNGVNKQD